MKHFAKLALGAALLLAVAGCATPSGQPWTPPPANSAPPSAAPATPAPSTAPESAAPASAAPASAAPASAAPASAAPASAAPSIAAGPRTVAIELNADGTITSDGQPLKDLHVTPGEVITFKVVNNTGGEENFLIGPAGDLMLGMTSGAEGLPKWNDTEPHEFQWTVPESVAGLKFGSTAGGKFGTMQGTFSVGSDATPAPATSEAPTATGAPASPAASAPAGSAEPSGRVIELQLNASLQIVDASGQQVKDIPVTPGETIVFKLTNTAGYIHNFWIGPDQALMTNQTAGLTGVPDWSDAEPRELVWVVPEDAATLKFGCTVPGHYSLMQGTFSVAS